MFTARCNRSKGTTGLRERRALSVEHAPLVKRDACVNRAGHFEGGNMPYFGAKWNGENSVIVDYEREERQEVLDEMWSDDDLDRCPRCGKKFYGDNDYCEWCEEEETCPEK
jgi:hypothetical protein